MTTTGIEVKRTKTWPQWPSSCTRIEISDRKNPYCAPEEGMRYIHVPGINFGPTAATPVIVHEDDDWHIVKMPGSTQWSGVGNKAYYPTRYVLICIVDGVWRRVASVEPRYRTKVGVDILKEIIAEAPETP